MLRPICSRRVGVAVEGQIGNVDVEEGSGAGDYSSPLPFGVGSNTMNQEQIRFGEFVGFRYPAVHSGVAIVEGGGSRFQAG